MFTRGSSSYKSGQQQQQQQLLAGSANQSSLSSSSSLRAHPLSLCADCGASGPSWASINRGVLLCSECTSVHRSLGRHISHVKSVRSNWIPEQLIMVQSLYSCGANSIWEYSLLNPGGGGGSIMSGGGGGGGGSGGGSGGGASSKSGVNRRKPSSSDPLHPIKSDFITAKYQQLAFVYKPAKDEPAVTLSELSRQLHSSVRTPNLETSLRLLSQGADPNYYHPEKNSTPLQVAARAGQSGQVELLLVYGADPGAVDKVNRTASEYAKQSGHSGLAARIDCAQYELSDRLSYFLCQRKPDHTGSTQQHFLIPEIEHDKDAADRKVAKRKLQGLNNAVFEELSMDVYDEVDRRETDAIWLSSSSSTTTSKAASAATIPFLPVNPDYGTTRNQGRQKLARLSQQEFSILVMDVLKEIRRRQTEMNSKYTPKMPSPLREHATSRIGAFKTKSLPVHHIGRLAMSSMLSDDEPIYDHVASDDDYYHIPDSNEEKLRPLSEASSSVNSSPAKSSGKSNSSKKSVTSGGGGITLVNPSEFKELRAQLESSEFKVQRLIESNDDMRGEISRLSVTVNKLVSENEQLRVTMSPTPHHPFNNHHQGTLSYGGYSGPNSLPPPPPVPLSSSSASMTLPARSFSSRTSLPIQQQQQQQQQQHHHYYDSAEPSPSVMMMQQQQQQQQQMQQQLPSQEEVVRRTEAITRCIQELLVSAKDEKFDAFIPCSERIVRAVTDMVVLFPEDDEDSSSSSGVGGGCAVDPAVSASLSALTAAAAHFEAECRVLILRSQAAEPLNQSFVTQQVIQCAFDIAKSTKQLVALFQ